jgi:hypothetical protein
MEQYLDAYIERIRPQVAGFPPSAAHELASAFLAFKYGLYENAVRECTHASTVIPAGAPGEALKKALLILKAHAEYRLNAQEMDNLVLAFSPAEQAFAAITIPPPASADAATLALDNALILVWTVALIASPDDEETLEEHREMILGILRDYKRAMGL